MTPNTLRRAATPDPVGDRFADSLADAYAVATARLRGDRTTRAPETPPTTRNRLSGANSPKDDQP